MSRFGHTFTNGEDDYNIIWELEDYKEPEKYKSELRREAISVCTLLTKQYTLNISYSEIQRYCSDKYPDSFLISDLFYGILKDMIDYETVVNNNSFPRDVAKLWNTFFDEGGVTFVFKCEFSRTIGSAIEKNNSDAALEAALKKFEKLDGIRNSENFGIICEDVKKSLKGIVGNEKGKGNTGIDIS